MKIIKISTPAKINLGLQVLNRRSDGYHNLRTIFAPISLFDELEVSESPEFKFTSTPELVFPVEENIIYKAFNLFGEKFGIESNVNIKLKKIIPMGAGLGGGSSDAAAALIAFRRLFDVPEEYFRLREITKILGSDVTFFLRQGIAEAAGRGSRLKYFSIKFNYSVLIVYPNIHVSTKWAYDELKRGPENIPMKNFMFRSIVKTDVHLLKNKLFNDFETVVIAKYPEIETIKKTMYEKDAFYSQMSGSGSAVYGLFVSENAAKKAMKFFPDYQCFLAKII